MCFFVRWCGPHGWLLDSTSRTWVILTLTSLVRLQIAGVLWWRYNPWRFCACLSGHMSTYSKRHHNRTWNTSELDVTQFVLRRRRSESCTEYWLWCVALFVGADRTADVSTRRLVREWSCPWHLWSDVRTSVKCVKDGRCREGSCTHLVRLQTYYTGLSR